LKKKKTKSKSERGRGGSSVERVIGGKKCPRGDHKGTCSISKKQEDAAVGGEKKLVKGQCTN